MALNGTISDFGLGDILQLIGIQRKTGVLTVERGEESVTVKFHEGQIVGADTRSRSVEEMLGAVLVRRGSITEDQLQAALRIQRKTLQRLGHILTRERFITADELVEALRVQSLQIVYRLFRWREGTYAFHQTENLEYDEQHFTPVSAETVLMEGARMVDEWPIIERRIRSEQMVLARTPAAAPLGVQAESLIDTDIDLGFELADTTDRDLPAQPTALRLSAEEREVLLLVDGRRSVGDITDCSAHGEFDTQRILADLMTRNLVAETRPGTAGEAGGLLERVVVRFAEGLLGLLLVACAVASLATLGGNPVTPWKIVGRDPAAAEVRRFASRARIEKIDHALQVFYLDAGSFPGSLEPLATNGYLHPAELRDPWNRPYGFALAPGGYRLVGLDASGASDPRLEITRQFTAAQRLMLAGEVLAPER